MRSPSLSEQLEQYESDRALLDPILKEARQDRDEIKRLKKLLGRWLAGGDPNLASETRTAILES